MAMEVEKNQQVHSEKSHLLSMSDDDILSDSSKCVQPKEETSCRAGQAGQSDTCNNPENTDLEIKHDDESQFKIFRLHGKDRRVLVLCVFMNFLTGCNFHGLSPFYPLEARTKHVSLYVTGLVFCVFEFVRFVIAEPITKKWILPRFGDKIVFIVGLIFSSGSCFLFSTATLLQSDLQFVLVSMLCRSGQAVGASCVTVATTKIEEDLCPTQRPSRTLLNTKDMGTTLGCIAGPIISGCFYSIGGFGLPFYVLGATTLANGIAIFCTVSFNWGRQHSNPMQHEIHAAQRVLLNHTMVISAMSVLTSSFIVTCLDPILVDHMTDNYGLYTSIAGLLFAIPPSINAILTPLWRRLAEDEDTRRSCNILGHFIVGAGCLIMGPTPILPFIPIEIWTTVAGLVLIGAGNGCLLLIAIASMNLECVHEDETISTGPIRGNSVLLVFDCSHFIGCVVGPIFGSVLMQQFGFRILTSAMACVSGTCVVVFVLMSVVCFVTRKCRGIRSGHEKDDRGHVQDCDRCFMRKRDGTFGKLPRHT